MVIASPQFNRSLLRSRPGCVLGRAQPGKITHPHAGWDPRGHPGGSDLQHSVPVARQGPWPVAVPSRGHSARPTQTPWSRRGTRARGRAGGSASSHRCCARSSHASACFQHWLQLAGFDGNQTKPGPCIGTRCHPAGAVTTGTSPPVGRETALTHRYGKWCFKNKSDFISLSLFLPRAARAQGAPSTQQLRGTR